MKKLLIILTLALFCNNADAMRLELTVNKEDSTRVANIGYKILNTNRIPHKMTFVVKQDKNANAMTYYRDNEINVTTPLLKVLNDDELASVIAHEISHGVDYRQGVLRGYFSYLSNSFNSKKYEYKADKRAIDYMVKAGYNPVASIIALNLIAPQTRFDWCSSHPLTTRRMATIYEYIYTKYPEYLVNNEYKNHPVYQNFLITSKENRQKLEKKIKNNSKRDVNYL